MRNKNDAGQQLIRYSEDAFCNLNGNSTFSNKLILSNSSTVACPSSDA
jgi:hypothetical protein